MLSRLAFAAAVAITTTAAMAAETTIGGVAISLPTPSGFCELSANDPSDNRMLTAIGSGLDKSGLKLLGMSADCQQLADWHTAKRDLLDDLVQYGTSIRTMDKTIPDTLIKDICAAAREQGEKILAEQTPNIKARIEEISGEIKVNEMKFLGVLAEDPNACYVAMMQKLRTEVGTDKTQVNVFADTIVKGKLILVYHISPYAGSDTVTDVLKRLKANVAALYAGNK